MEFVQNEFVQNFGIYLSFSLFVPFQEGCISIVGWQIKDPRGLSTFAQPMCPVLHADALLQNLCPNVPLPNQPNTTDYTLPVDPYPYAVLVLGTLVRSAVHATWIDKREPHSSKCN